MARPFVIITLFLCLNAFGADDLTLTQEVFDDALNRSESHLASLVRNPTVEPHWVKDKNRFWYRRTTSGGFEVVIVDPASGEKAMAYDMAVMKQTLDGLIESDTGDLASTPVSLTGGIVTFNHSGQNIECTIEDERCRFNEITSPTPELLVSPMGSQGLFVRDHNLWLRDLADGSEKRLTEDGEKYAAYASPSDQATLGAKASPESRDSQPEATYWSPSGRWVLTQQVDERNVQPYPFLESVPANGGFRPEVHEVRVALLGDENLARSRVVILDLEKDLSYPIELPDGFDLNDIFPGHEPLGWSRDGNKSYIYASTIDAKIGRLLEIDMATGGSRTLIEEHAPDSRVYISANWRSTNVRILDNEIIWFSERDGYGHLYLYDLASGELKRQLTRGSGSIRSILHVEQERRSLLVSRGRGEENDPYELAVYRVSLDGSAPVLLTPEAAHHVVPVDGVSPTGDYFVATHSTLSSPPRSALYSVWNDGEKTTLETADTSALLETGWRVPRRVRVKAADGETDIYAVLYEPYQRLGNSEKAPIIDLNYINSIASIAPVSFMDAFKGFHVESLRQLGFYVVMVDGRGTPYRSRAFREAGYPVFYPLQVEDHVAAIEQLAKRFDGVDTGRVGIWGSSNGGAGAARAILQRPDFFKVAVASAGSHDYMSLPPSGVKYFGVPRYSDGSAIRPSDDAVPENYLGFDNAALAQNLQGHLLLAYGDKDNLALPSATLRLVDALIDAGKTFDVLPMPNHGHFFLFEPYFKRRLADYFVRHLHGVDPHNWR